MRSSCGGREHVPVLEASVQSTVNLPKCMVAHCASTAGKKDAVTQSIELLAETDEPVLYY